jgi:hypothetical protein
MALPETLPPLPPRPAHWQKGVQRTAEELADWMDSLDRAGRLAVLSRWLDVSHAESRCRNLDHEGYLAHLTEREARLREALVLEPCHITGMHDPTHTTRYVCEHQLADLGRRAVVAAGYDPRYLPKRLHGPGCGWCNRVPTDEADRVSARALHAWAGVSVPEALAQPAPDCPQENDPAWVLAVLDDQYLTWQDGTKMVALRQCLPYFPIRRWWAAVEALGDRVERRDISTRLRQPENAPPALEGPERDAHVAARLAAMAQTGAQS